MTGIVVADVALASGILSTEMFVGIVVSAIVSSLLVALWLSWSIRRRRPVRLLDHIQEASTRPSLEGTTRAEVIDELVSQLALPAGGPLANEGCAAAVHAREDLVGTGVGHSVALPHARLPGLDETILAFGRSRPGIDWDAPDGLPVHLVFLLLSPEKEYGLQLQIMARLAAVLSSPAVQDALLRADDQDVWWELQRALQTTAADTLAGHLDGGSA